MECTFSSCHLHMRHQVIQQLQELCPHPKLYGFGLLDPLEPPHKFTLLLIGGNEFDYESCVHLETSSGSVKGSLPIVRRRLQDPKGNPFQAKVAAFPVQLPDYIF